MALGESIDSFLNRAQVAIDNALSTPQIQEYLKEYGYTPEKIQTGKTLYETALAAQQKQRQEYGEQISATEALNRLWEEAQTSYMRWVKIARIAFKNNPGIATELAINGTRKRTLSGWLLQAKQFYLFFHKKTLSFADGMNCGRGLQNRRRIFRKQSCEPL